MANSVVVASLASFSVSCLILLLFLVREAKVFYFQNFTPKAPKQLSAIHKQQSLDMQKRVTSDTAGNIPAEAGSPRPSLQLPPKSPTQKSDISIKFGDLTHSEPMSISESLTSTDTTIACCTNCTFSAVKWRSSHFFAACMSLTTIFIFTIATLVVVLLRSSEIGGNPIMTCSVFAPFNIILYFLGKAPLYCVLITRLDIAFKRSVYEYSKWTIRGGYILVALFVIIGVLVSIIGVASDEVNGMCETIIEAYLFMYIGATDSLFMIVTLVLFVIPLIKLSAAMRRTAIDTETSIAKHISRNKSDARTADIATRDISIKYTALSFVMLISTFILSTIAGAFGGSASDPASACVGPHYVVTVSCLLAMHARYSTLYNRVCCGADRFCLGCMRCCLCCRAFCPQSRVQGMSQGSVVP